MFLLGVLIGIFSYIIFILGITNLLFKPILFCVSFVYILVLFLSVKYFNKNLNISSKTLVSQLKNLILYNSKFTYIILLLLSLLALINLIGVLGPEYAFDAVWYHLTIPKIYLNNHSIFFIPGSLLYYSAMPKLTEMLFLVGLAFNDEIIAKIIHFSFGILCIIALYIFSRKYFSRNLSLLVGLLFYSNLVISWESITAYIDLARTYYEFLTMWAILLWVEKGKRKWLIVSAVMLGLSISTKLLSIGSFIFYLPLIFYISYKRSMQIRQLLINIILFITCSIFIALPWFIFAYINTGNPLYPVFSGYQIESPLRLFSLELLIRDFINIFLFADDPITPIYIISLPLIIVMFYRFRTSFKLLTIYTLFSLIIWYFTPRSGGGRFLLPYLPAFSILIGEVIRIADTHKVIKQTLITSIIFIACISIVYRGAANSKYIPVIIGVQSKDTFLTNNLNFSFGDFYDTDSYFRNNIRSTDKVLLYGFHNLYYINFPYIDSSWVKKGDRYNYVAIQNTNLPKQYTNWEKIYTNQITKVSLYTKDRKFYFY